MKKIINVLAFIVIVTVSLNGKDRENISMYNIENACILDLVCQEFEGFWICCGVCTETGEINSCGTIPKPTLQ